MKHLGTKTLETKRLILRKTIDSDVQPMFNNWANDERVTKFLNWKPYTSAKELEDTYHKYLMESQKNKDFYDWKIVLRSIGEPVGAIGAVNLREDIGEVGIGYCLGYNWWHQGIMTEALSEVIRFFFKEVEIKRIFSWHDAKNPHSGDVMKKCGLKYEGTLRQAGINNQGIFNSVFYSILKEEYDC